VEHAAIDRAIVIGISNPKYGQVVGAFLQRSGQRRLGDDEVRAWVRERLGRHKAPLHVFWLGEEGVPGEVPLTGSGKVKKFEMVRVAEELVNNGGEGQSGAPSAKL